MTTATMQRTATAASSQDLVDPKTLSGPELGVCGHCGGRGYDLTRDRRLPAHPVAGGRLDRPACPGGGSLPTDTYRDGHYPEGPWT